jgi:glycosyltransferase involved in cell wall biosynthesis
MPMWDRESGAVRMRGILQTLIDAGCHVVFLPDNFNPEQPYTRELQRMGVEVLYGIEIPQDIARVAASLSLVLLSRPQVAGRWLEMMREYAPRAAVVYDTVDLHWLREARRALAGTGAEVDLSALPAKAAAMRELELAMIRATDATLVVTEEERRQVLDDVPAATVHVVPNVHEISRHVSPVAGRSGVLFVGGFEHTPNAEAALALVHEVMPRVWATRPDVKVRIVGPGPPPEVQGLAGPRVEVMGWVADLDAVIESARALVAPLRYGAGMKGKVTQALAAGLPVITTPVGAEGLDPRDGEQMLVGQTAQELAERVLRLLGDDDLWSRLSREGQSLASERCSFPLLAERLADVLAAAPLWLTPAAPATTPAR